MYSFSAATKSPRSHASFAASNAFDAATLAAFAASALPHSREASAGRQGSGDGGRRAEAGEASTVRAIAAATHRAPIDPPATVYGRRSFPLRLCFPCPFTTPA